MKLPLIIAVLAGAAAAANLATAQLPAGTCKAASGAHKIALVELYTSEGCSSCPPADRLLAQLGRLLPPDAQATPIALHVDYWDALGWKDPYAQAAFSERHGRLVRANGHTVVYTPHFFVDGRELKADGAAVRDAVREINSRAAPATLQASARIIDDHLDIDLSAQADPLTSAALYIAVTQDGLASQVSRGENRGVRLEHDHVARNWIGPLALVAGAIAVHRSLPIGGLAGTRTDIVAFVEDTRTGAVLQSIAANDCDPAASSRVTTTPGSFSRKPQALLARPQTTAFVPSTTTKE